MGGTPVPQMLAGRDELTAILGVDLLVGDLANEAAESAARRHPMPERQAGHRMG